MNCEKCLNKCYVCPNCGAEININTCEGRSWVVSIVLCFFLGYLGVHRFYTGYIGIGIFQLFTFGGFGIWAFIDFIMILFNAYKTKNGNCLCK